MNNTYSWSNAPESNNGSNQNENQWSSGVTAAGASIGNNGDTRLAKELVLRGETIERKPARVAKEGEIEAVIADLQKQREELAATYVRKASKYPAPANAILSILRQSSQSVGRSGFGQTEVEAEMKARLQTQIDANRPVALPLLMGGGKVANPLKTGSGYLPDLAEWIGWSTLEAIGLAIQAVYEPGARIIAIPDASLHTADLGMPIEETLAHAKAAQQDLQRLGLKHVVIPDVLPYLGSEWVEGIGSLIEEARRRAAADPVFAADVQSQTESLNYSINTRVFGRPFADLLLVYAAAAGHREGVEPGFVYEAEELRRRSKAVGYHYVAVNWAIRQRKLVERIVADLNGSPDHLRLSVHAKRGEPRPALFAASKHFPSLSGLLPMHGVGVRLLAEDKVRYGAAFELAARLRGWTPVVEPGTGRFLWFEADATGGNA